MQTPDAFELIREALFYCVLLASPLLLVALVAGTVSGILQTVTQVHEHSLSVVPKLLAVLLASALFLPWILRYLGEYTETLIRNIPQVIAGG